MLKIINKKAHKLKENNFIKQKKTIVNVNVNVNKKMI